MRQGATSSWNIKRATVRERFKISQTSVRFGRLYVMHVSIAEMHEVVCQHDPRLRFGWRLKRDCVYKQHK